MEELEKLEQTACKQWQMAIERCEYEAQLAEKRYMEVDPYNRLVASTLEQRWNDALLKLDDLKHQYSEFQKKDLTVASPDQIEKVIALTEDLPCFWNDPTTSAKDKKRILRLVIKDVTVERIIEKKEVLLHIRWQGGVSETLSVEISTDHLKYSDKFVEKVKQLAKEHSDSQIAAILNEEGQISCRGKSFSSAMIKWVRYKYKIPLHQKKNNNEFTVRELAEKLSVSTHVVYYWIERDIIKTRRVNGRISPYWITIDSQKEKELIQWIQRSSRIQEK